MKYRLYAPFALLASALTCLGVAQDGKPLQGTLPPPVLVDRVSSVDMNTGKFVKQIDDTYIYHPRRPKNPKQYPVLPGIPNDLVAGGMGTYNRVGATTKWPAIGKTGWTPPDPDLAVGPNHIVAVVNSSIAFFSKIGGKQFQQTSETFFSGLGAGSFQYDPKVLYDRVHERFVIIFLEQSDADEVSKVLLAVSDDDNPNGTWHRYRIEAKMNDGGGNPCWLDYPGFGYNKDAIVVCGNMFGFSSGWGGVQFLVMHTAPMLTGGTAEVYSVVDATGASTQIAEVIDAESPRVFAVSRSGSNALRVYSIENPGTSSPSITFTSVPVPTNATPGFAAPSTNGQELDSLDGRIFNAVVRDGRLLCAHCIQVGLMLQSRWYDVDLGTWPTSGSPSLNQSGNLSADEVHYFSPAINMNAAGDIGVIFSGSSGAVTADIMITGRHPVDPIGEMGAPIFLEGSVGDSYTSYRWGDYFGVDVDPVDDTTFWGIAMDVDSENGWKTSVFSWLVTSKFPDLDSLSVDPTNVSGTAGSTGTVTLTDPAPAGGTKVKLKSSLPKVASVPSIIVVPNGETTMTFPIRTFAQSKEKVITITGTAGKTTRTAELTVGPLGIRSLTLNPDSVLSGLSAIGTVEIGAPAPAGGALVTVAVDKPKLATVNWRVNIPEGERSASFTIGTVAVGADTNVIVRAANPGPTVYATLKLLANLGLSKITVSPTSVKGGRTAKGVVYLSAAAPTSLVVNLTISDPSAATIPATVTIRRGAKTGSFSIRTSRTTSRKQPTITAAYGGASKTATFTINR